MIHFRRILVAGAATMLFAVACTNVTIPSIPPIVIPSFSIPSFAIPSGVPIPGSSTGTIGDSPCTLVTAQEMSTILGGAVTDTSDGATECVFVTGSFAGYSISVETGASIDGIKLAASNGEDLQIAGNRAYYVNFINDQLYVEKGGKTLLIQAVLQSGKKDALVAMANLAVGRF